MNVLLQDIHYALRSVAKRPLYAVISVLVFALAMGANTTVFSIFSAFLLRPMPFPDDERLVMVYNTYPNMGLENAGVSIPDYLDRREQAGSLENLAIYTFMDGMHTVGTEGDAQTEQILRASPSLFDVLGVAPLLGRTFTESDAEPGNDKVLVLSHALWNSRFGADPGIVGRDVRVDGEPFRVVGVMPEGFGFPSNVAAWRPFAFTPAQTSDEERGMEFSMSIGRLRPGATIEGLNAELDTIVRRVADRMPQRAEFMRTTAFTGRAQPLREQVVGDLEQMLVLLQGVVLAVLLIACANVANLQLARTTARRRELSVRAALGASQPRLATLVIVESLVLALMGAGAGLLLGQGGIALVRALGLDRAAQGFELTLDARVLAFTAATAVLAALASAFFPVLSLMRADLAAVIQHGGRLGGGQRVSQPFRNGLVVAQVALSVALLVGAGLLAKSFYEVQREDTGFSSESVWTGRLALPRARYDDTSGPQLIERALEELQALPGVVSAGYTTSLPFGGGGSATGNIVVDGYEPPDGQAPPHVFQRIISEGFLSALGIPVVAGRNFAADESEPVVIVDEIMASKYWPDGNVLGQRVRLDFGPDSPWYTVVGVVPTVKYASLTEAPSKETVYWHYRQAPPDRGAFVLRSALPPDQLTRVAGDVIAKLDPDLSLFDVKSMQTRITESLGPQRTPMILTLVFAAIAFTLAVVGIYGVLTWAATQRFGEIGVRMAIGAERNDIVRMLLGHGARLIGMGLVGGIAGAVALGRLMSSQIYNVSYVDPTIYAVAITGLAATALLATWLPARRASRIDPIRALRDE
jgi:predicted permease